MVPMKLAITTRRTAAGSVSGVGGFSLSLVIGVIPGRKGGSVAWCNIFAKPSSIHLE